LALGASSSGEIADFELNQVVEAEAFRQQLADALPTDIPIYNVEELDLKASAATQLLEAAEYLITVAAFEEMSSAKWQELIDTIKTTNEIWYEHKTKSGKTHVINLRDRLFDIELLETKTQLLESTRILRYVGSCRNDGTLLRPEQILFMLEQVASVEFQLLHIHRNQLILGV
jgi:radical SAM-linked protein